MKNTSELRHLGRTRLSVTALGFGTTGIGGLYSATSAQAAEETMETAWELGVRFFDTAPQYGNGMAERRLGAFLATKARDEYVLCTKVGWLLRMPERGAFETSNFKDTPPERPIFDFTYDGVMICVEESLKRLGVEQIDVLHIHDPDDHFTNAITGAYKALDKLRSEGAIGAVGVGMNQSEMLIEFARNGDFDCFLLAGRYTLLEQGALKKLLPLCAERNISVIIGGVYNSGILANPIEGAKFNYRDATPGHIERALELERVCLRHGVPLKAAALQFPLAHPAVASVLTRARSRAEALENDALFHQRVPAALWQDLKAEGLVAADAPTACAVRGRTV
jgi:D-threo-aldose 1-dehydrogenase